MQTTIEADDAIPIEADDLVLEQSKERSLFTDFDSSVLQNINRTEPNKIKTQKEWNLTGAFSEAHKSNKISKFYSLKEKILLLKQEEGIKVTSEKEQQNKKESSDSHFQGRAKQFYHKNDMISFDEFMLSKPLLKACRELDYDHPTPIQRKAIPLILDGKDILGTAVTGSGKTASFLVPLIQLLLRQGKGKVRVARSKVLILNPARELAAQCHAMLQHVLRFLPHITSALVIGGADAKREEAHLRSRPDVVIATPGRLLDHALNSRSIDLNDVRYLVMDEADKLLEMGFKEEVHQIIKLCSGRKQTLLFSATLSESVQSLAQVALKKPSKINTAQHERKNMKLTQYIVRLKQGLDQEEKKDAKEDDSSSQEEQDQAKEDEKKLQPYNKMTPQEKIKLLYREATLIALCKRHFKKRVIVFFNTCKECHSMLGVFTYHDLKAQEVHGMLQQKERLEAIRKFQDGEVDFLLSTDLLSRGLDIHNVSAVINFEFPREIARYTHRIGRTARAGESGVALTICDEEERRVIKKTTRKDGQLYTYSVQMKYVEQIKERIAQFQPKLEELLTAEKSEMEIRKTEIELNRAQNIIKHKEEIKAKPKRQEIESNFREWFQSSKEKMKLKQASREAVMKSFEKVANAEQKAEKKGSKKKVLKRELKLKQKEQERRNKEFREQKSAKRELKHKGQKKVNKPQQVQKPQKKGAFGKEKH